MTCNKAEKKGLLPAGEKCPGCKRNGACLLKMGVWRPGLDGGDNLAVEASISQGQLRGEMEKVRGLGIGMWVVQLR